MPQLNLQNDVTCHSLIYFFLGPQKSKLYCDTYHLPPLGVLCDHPELSYFPLEKTLWTNDDDDEGAFNIDDVTCHSLIYKIMSHATA